MFHTFCPRVLSAHVASLPLTRTVDAFSREVFEHLASVGVRKVIAFVPDDNKRAVALATRLGFIKEGHSPSVWPRVNGVVAIDFYGLELCQQ
jgi:L-amino acid N-acyltransferase YncA